MSMEKTTDGLKGALSFTPSHMTRFVRAGLTGVLVDDPFLPDCEKTGRVKKKPVQKNRKTKKNNLYLVFIYFISFIKNCNNP